MDKKTKFKVTVITIAGVVVTWLYINHRQVIYNFKISQREREWQTTEPQGKLIGGMKNGEWRTYFKSGQIARIQNYKNDTLDGKQIFYTPQGHYKSRADYKMGVPVDSFFLYYSNGLVNLEEFKNQEGRGQGVFKVYYDNGQLSQIGQKVNGRFDGEFRAFYKSGELKEIESYKLGQRTGKWLWFSENGDTTKVEVY